MADDEVAGPTGKAEKAVIKQQGLSRMPDKESPKPKSSAVMDISKEVGSLKKTMRELKQYNTELKLQMEQQEARVSSQIMQQGAKLDGKFGQIMELLTKQGSQKLVSQARPGIMDVKSSRKRKVEPAEQDFSDDDFGD